MSPIWLWLVASVAFAFGWALRSLSADASMADKQETNRILLDWGACHALLDYLQLATGERRLLPRVRLLVRQLVEQVGWPTGAPPPERTPVKDAFEIARPPRRRKGR